MSKYEWDVKINFDRGHFTFKHKHTHTHTYSLINLKEIFENR